LLELIEKYSECRADFYKNLKSFPVFGKGWLNRVEKEKLEAIDLIKNN
jgi:lysozyme family protein